MDSEDGLMENNIKYLFNLSDALPNNLNVLKSSITIRSRVGELVQKTSLPAKITKATVLCPRCCLNFSEYPPNMKLQPKRKPDRFTRKMLRKIDAGQNLTSYQKKFSTLLKKRSTDNTMIQTCNFCNKEINLRVTFPVEKIEKKINEETPVLPKKKKKGKDKFAGLTPSAVMSLTQTKENIKKNVMDILQENKEEPKANNEIKYNVIGTIGDKKKKKKSQRKKEVAPPVLSTKMKIMEKKNRQANLKQKNNLNNLLNSSNKITASNVLSSFLDTL